MMTPSAPQQSSAAIRAVPCPVPDRARELARLEPVEYMDAFAIRRPSGDSLPAEAWARVMFTPRSRWSYLGARAWLWGTGVETSSTGAPIGPFQLVLPDERSAVLVAFGPRYYIRLVVLATDDWITLATFVQDRGAVWRVLLKPIMFAHRRVAPRILQGAVAIRNRQALITRGEPILR